MVDVIWLAVAGLRARWGRAVVLLLAVALVVATPAALTPLGGRLAARWRAPAEAVSVVVGAPGSASALVLSTVLWADGEAPAPIPWAARDTALAVPGIGVSAVVRRGRAAGAPVVGLEAGAPSRLGWSCAEGRWPAVLGEAVVGAAVAQAAGVGVGDRVLASAGDPGDPSASPPLRLRVVGVMAPGGDGRDGLVMTSVETAWALGGALHGHAPEAGDEDVLEGSLAAFDPADPAAAPETWHLHGDREDQPVHALLVSAVDAQARDRLLGRLALEEDLMAVRPVEVVEGLMARVGRIEALLQAVAALVAGVALLLGTLVVVLLARERADELALLRRLGASRVRIAAILGTEAAGVVGLGVAVGLALAGLSADRLVAIVTTLVR